MVPSLLILSLLLLAGGQQMLLVAFITSSSTPPDIAEKVHSNFEALRIVVQNEYRDKLAVVTYWEHVDLTDPNRDFVLPPIIEQESIKVFLEATCHPAYSRFLAYSAYMSDLLHIVLERVAEADEVPGPNTIFMEPSSLAHAQAFAELIIAFGWTHVGLFYNSEVRNQHSASEFKRVVIESGAQILDEALIDNTASSTLLFIEGRLRTTKSTKAKVAVVFADNVTASQLLLSADENGIGGAGFVWLLNAEAMEGITDVAKLSNADFATFRFGLLKTGTLGLIDADAEMLQREPIYYYLLLARMVVKAAASGINSGSAVRKYLLSNPINGDFPLRFSPEGFREVALVLYNMVDFSLFEVGRWDPVLNAVTVNKAEIVWPGGGLQPPNDQISIINLAVLVPLTDEKGVSMAVGRSVVNGITIAVREINSNPEVLQNSVLVPVFLNTANSPSLAAANVRSVANANILGFIGPYSSEVLPAYLKEDETLLDMKPLVSYGASSANFTSPDKFPYFLRMIQPDGIQAVALALFVGHLKWKRVGVIYTADDYGRGLYASFASNTDQLQIEMANDVMRREVIAETGDTLSAECLKSIEGALDAITESQTRVIVYLGSWRVGAQLVLRAGKRDLTGSLYVWLGAMWLSPSILKSLQSIYSPTDYQDLLVALEGCIALDSMRLTSEVGQRFQSTYESQFKEPPSIFSALAYDAVYLYSRAISSMLARGEDYYRGKDLTDALRTSEFTGASGPVHFSGGTNDRSAYGLSVLNMQAGTLQEVYVYDPLSPTIFNTTAIALLLPDSNIIEDSFAPYNCPFPLHMVSISPPGLAVVIAIGFSLFVLTLGLSLFSYSKWKLVEITLIREHVKKTWRDSLVELTIAIEFFQLLALAPKFEAVQIVLKDLSNIVMLDIMSMSKVSQTNDSSSYWKELVTISVICYVWFVMVLMITFNMDRWLKKVPGSYKLFTLVSGVYLPLVGNSLFLPFLTLLLDAFVCDHEEQGRQFVWRDCYMTCWTPEHYSYVAVSAIAIIVFEPIAVFSRPMWQQSKLGLNLMLKPLFLLFKTCTQILLIAVGKSLQGTSTLAHGVVFSTLMLAYCLVSIRVLPFNYHRCNLWEIATLLAVLYFSLIATFSPVYNPQSLGWFVGLLVGWGVIILSGIGIQLKKFPSHFRIKGDGKQRRVLDVLRGRPANARAAVQPEEVESLDLNVIAPSVSPEELSQLSAPREEKPETERSDIELKPQIRDESEVRP